MTCTPVNLFACATISVASRTQNSGSTYLYHQLDVICHAIAGVGGAVLVRLVADFQKGVHLLLVDADMAGDLGKPLIRLVSCLVDDVRVEEGRLLLEEGLAELPEFRAVGLQYRSSCLVYQGGRRMPWLYLSVKEPTSSRYGRHIPGFVA